MSLSYNHIRRSYRPDIDGLRALAVLSVVAYHFFPSWIKGGFIGVDIFFVISGFLITTIILQGLHQGTFNFADFYAQRIKRIFPSLLIVLTGCYSLGWFILLTDEYKQLGKHVAAGAGFISNLILLSEGGYFDNSADTKPLLHLWSLSIEEQFYLFWPLLLWLAFRNKINILKIMVIIIFVSLIINLKSINENTSAAFYLPQTRLWEFLMGSLVSLSNIDKKNLNTNRSNKINFINFNHLIKINFPKSDKIIANITSIFGCLCLFYSYYRITKEVKFPGIWAVFPVLGAVLIIKAGPIAWINRNVLSNKIAVWFGLISYPLYLWHWPLLSFARIIEGEIPSREIRIMIFLVSVFVAWLSYKFIERPVRFGRNSKYTKIYLFLFIITIGIIGFITYIKDGINFRQIAKNTYIDTTAITVPDHDLVMQHCRDIIAQDYKGNCMTNVSQSKNSIFDYYFIGDSHSVALSFPLYQSRVKFLSLGRGGCLPFRGVDRFNAGLPYHCEITVDKIYDEILNSANKKSMIIITARFSAYIEGSGYGQNDTNSQPPDWFHIQPPGKIQQRSNILYNETFKLGLKNTLVHLTKSFDKLLIVLQAPELGFDPRKCIDRNLGLNKFECTVSKNAVLARQKKYRDTILEVLVDFPNVIVYDPLNLLCDSLNCYARRNGILLYRDGDHLNYFGAQVVLEDLRSKSLLP